MRFHITDGIDFPRLYDEIQVGRNICHGSDSVENAEREIGLWFEDGEVLDWTDHSFDWVYE